MRQNNCAHAAGVLVYVAQLCRHVRVLNEDDEGEEATQSTGDAEVTPPTSKPRAWGLPSQKRKVTPSEPMEQLNFKRVRMDEDFCATEPDAGRTEQCVRAAERRVEAADVASLIDKLQGWSTRTGNKMVMLDYTGQLAGELLPSEPSIVTCPFDIHRPKPIRFPARFASLWAQQRQLKAEPTTNDVDEWKCVFLRLLKDVDRVEVVRRTSDQASSDEWYLERVIRVIASKIGSVITRVRDFDTLARQHLYQAPPTNLPSLRFSRGNEPVGVDLFCKTFPSRIVSASGLIIHPDIPYLAASPDRLVTNPECTPPDGINTC